MNTHSNLFYLKRSKTDKTTGKVPIYMRITINGNRTEISIKRKIIPEKWDTKAHCAKGTKEEAQILNSFLKNWEHKVNKIVNQLQFEEKEITISSFKNCFCGVNKEKHTLIEAIEYNNSI